MMSTRKLRIAGIVALLILLIIVFIRFDEHLSSIPSQFRNFTQHDGSSTSHSPPPAPEEGVRWSEFAYVQYVTNSNYLCNSLMILEALRRHGTKADLLMLYPREWKLPEDNHSGADVGYESRLLAQARDHYRTKLSPIQVQTITNGNDPTWQDSYTKLLAWNQTQYKRVISLDSDATVLDVRSLYAQLNQSWSGC
jgi:alpha-N-acetylglucosamine transferase